MAVQRNIPSVESIRTLISQGLVEAAARQIEVLVRACPDDLRVLVLAADIESARGNGVGAIARLTRARAVDPRNIHLRLRLAQQLYDMGRAEEAMSLCVHEVSDRQVQAELLSIAGLIDERKGAFASALEHAERISRIVPSRRETTVLKSRALHGLGRTAESIDVARDALAAPATPFAIRRALWFQLAKSLDAEGRFDEAFAACQSAHAESTASFDLTRYASMVDAILAVFDARNIRALTRSPVEAEQAAFVVGMPRSGTTLVEQVIHAHPNGFGAGELDDLSVWAQSMTGMSNSMHDYPESLQDVDAELATKIGERYLAKLRSIAKDPSKVRIVNKALDLFEHVGMAWQFLPGARFIHVSRDPMDTCLSCFTRPLNSRWMPYASNLGHLAFVYRQHERLMRHWMSLPGVRLLVVNYERLVCAPGEVIPEITAFLGLPWSDRCSRYWESDRTVMTLSYDQVNRPPYPTSIGRWKNYEKHLGQLAGELDRLRSRDS